MKAGIAVVGVCVVLAGVGCGGDESSDESSTEATTTSTTAAATPEEAATAFADCLEGQGGTIQSNDAPKNGASLVIADLPSGNVAAFSGARDEDEVGVIEKQFNSTDTTAVETQGLSVYGFRDEPSSDDQSIVEDCLGEIGS